MPQERRNSRLAAMLSHMGVHRAAPRQIPEAWIGQEVLVHAIDHHEMIVVLEDVREFGFVYSNQGDSELIFSPWTTVRWMRPPGTDAEVINAEVLP